MLFWCLWSTFARAALVETGAQILWVSEGSPGDQSFGWVAREMPDVNGDGAMDVIVGSPFEANQIGRTHILSGKTGETLHTLAQPGERLQGTAVAPAGDVNGDGLPDLLSGAPGSGRGAALVYSGDGTLLMSWSGEENADNFGIAVTGAGDANGDGYDDVVIGADHANTMGVDSGRAYVMSGADGALLYTLEAESEGDLLGAGLGTVGDLDGDERDDIVVGAPDAGNGGRGAIYTFSGADGERLSGPLRGGLRGFDLGRYFVDGLGDSDGDGIAEVFGADFTENSATGAVYVFSGADGAERMKIEGDYQGEGLGCGRGGGDFDGDGIEDLALGAWKSNDGAAEAGQVVIHSGADGAILATFTSIEVGENFGFDAAGLGDVNGDGEVDILVGAATGDRVYAVSNRPEEVEEDTAYEPDPPEDKRCGTVNARASLWMACLALCLSRGRSR